MSTAKIAIRYAKPLLELAEEKGALEQVYDDLKGFISLCKENREFLLMLKSPIISNLKKATILSTIFTGKVHELTSSFFDLVTKKSREVMLQDIAAEFIKLYNAKKGLQEAVVTTTIPMDDESRNTFAALIKKVTGKEAIITEKVDPELIGGYVIKLDDQQIDDSVSGKLRDLQLRFQNENK